MALCRAGATRPLSECLESVDWPEGRQRVAEHLAALARNPIVPFAMPGLRKLEWEKRLGRRCVCVCEWSQSVLLSIRIRTFFLSNRYALGGSFM